MLSFALYNIFVIYRSEENVKRTGVEIILLTPMGFIVAFIGIFGRRVYNMNAHINGGHASGNDFLEPSYMSVGV